MKLIIRIIMLIAIMAGLVAGYFWLMRRYTVRQVSEEGLAVYQQQIKTSPEGSISLTGQLKRIDFYYYLDLDDKTRLPVVSQSIELHSYRDKRVTVKLRSVGSQLEIFQIEELGS